MLISKSTQIHATRPKMTDHGPSTSTTAKTRSSFSIVWLFIASIGSTVSYLCVLSQLEAYSNVFGADFYIGLNMSLFGPLLPVSMLQARYDGYFDSLYTLKQSLWFRGYFGYGGTILCLLLVPRFSNSHSASSPTFLLLVMVGLGTASASLQGTLRQVVAGDHEGTAVVTAGMQAAAIVVWLVQTLVASSSRKQVPTKSSIKHFYRSIVLVEVVCWVAFGRVLEKYPLQQPQPEQPRPSLPMLNESLADDNLEESLGCPSLLRRSSNDDNDELVVGKETTNDDIARFCPTEQPPPSSYRKLCQQDPSCFVVLLSTVASSMAVASWFNRFGKLSPVLFYVRLLGDLLGRPATLATQATCHRWNATQLLAMTRLLFVPYFFLVALGRLPLHGAILTVGVGLFAASSGYIATVCYQVKASAEQTKVLNVWFSISVWMGLIASLFLSRLESTDQEIVRLGRV